SNLEAAAWCDLAFVSVPYSGHRALLEPLKDALRGKIIVDATVPIDPANILRTKTESGKSAAEETAAIIPEADKFAELHTISHRILRDPTTYQVVLVSGGSNR